ncbi:two-component system, OmpR family, sensor histidine kinase TctE [Faunimonas pinastri]|uniref:histidine kinase n=1 Tax=Faunimonas pinastri TaxID=1855383 RepID=A0A1H9CTX2_9HYPH|nr:sensor histidine kinase [Faunimonas pinastri]SEQ04672.1 two-component system, OmpR family, sensor histidine kinase TctE [Faunimonas pinastri]
MRIESLRLQLLGWILLPLAVVMGFNVWIGYGAARRTADLVTDQLLLASARSIAEATRADVGIIEATIPPAALEMFDTGHHDHVYYRVQTGAGRLLTGYPDLPLPREPATEARPVTYAGIYRGGAVHLIAFSHPSNASGDDSSVLVVVGTTLNSHRAMTRQLWAHSFGQQLLLLCAAGILALVGLQRGLAPLLRLRNAVRGRGRQDLSPLSVGSVQSELRPLVGALNDHMGRVQAQMAAQRRFVANAAHQIRTPLALLSTQTAFALRQTEGGERTETLKAVQVSTRQLARLASQLLTLARAEPGSRRPRAEPVDLAQAAREVLENLMQAALARRIDLGLEVDETVEGTALTRGDGTMIREMIVNLVDNAIRYTPEGGSVTVRVECAGDQVLLAVSDSGPGIPPAEREHVFERFYRVLGTSGEGSGLGLAIVREVLDSTGGTARLDDAPEGGLLVEIKLPATGVAGRS